MPKQISCRRFSADLFTFTEEILNQKLHFSCSVVYLCGLYVMNQHDTDLLLSAEVGSNIFSAAMSQQRVKCLLNLITLNPLSAKITKWSNTLKQFVGNLPTNCLSVFDHFVGLALKGLMTRSKEKSVGELVDSQLLLTFLKFSTKNCLRYLIGKKTISSN